MTLLYDKLNENLDDISWKERVMMVYKCLIHWYQKWDERHLKEWRESYRNFEPGH